MNPTLMLSSSFPPRSTLLLLVLLAASANPLLGGPALRIAAREDAEVAEAKVSRRASSGRAAREATMPATVTWTRTEPATTSLDTAGSVLWRNKGAIGLGAVGYIAVTQPVETLDGLARVVHGTGESTPAASTADTSQKLSLMPTTTTVVGSMVVAAAPYVGLWLIGIISVPLFRFVFRPRNR